MKVDTVTGHGRIKGIVTPVAMLEVDTEAEVVDVELLGLRLIEASEYRGEAGEVDHVSFYRALLSTGNTAQRKGRPTLRGRV